MEDLTPKRRQPKPRGMRRERKKKRKIRVEIQAILEVDIEDVDQVTETLEACRGYGSAEVVDVDVIL